MPKVRFNVDLETELFNWLEAYKDKEDISRNEAVRRGVNLLKNEKERVHNG